MAPQQQGGVCTPEAECIAKHGFYAKGARLPSDMVEWELRIRVREIECWREQALLNGLDGGDRLYGSRGSAKVSRHGF